MAGPRLVSDHRDAKLCIDCAFYGATGKPPGYRRRCRVSPHIPLAGARLLCGGALHEPDPIKIRRRLSLGRTPDPW